MVCDVEKILSTKREGINIYFSIHIPLMLFGLFNLDFRICVRSSKEKLFSHRFSAKIRYGKIISSLPFVTSGKARHLEVVKTD